MNTKIFKKDSVITCEQEHYICKLAKDVESGEIVGANLFYEFGDAHTEPITGQSINSCVCGYCGSMWIKSERIGGVHVHFAKGGWTYKDKMN